MTQPWLPSFEGSTEEVVFGPLCGETLDRLDTIVDNPNRYLTDTTQDAVVRLRECVEASLAVGGGEDITMLRTARTREVNSLAEGYALFEQPGRWEVHTEPSADPQVRMVRVREAPSAW